MTIDALGNFAATLYVNIGQFVQNDGSTPLSAFQTGLGSNYQLYALFQTNGTISSDSSGVHLNITPNSGLGLQLWLDPLKTSSNPTFFTPNSISNPASGSVYYTPNVGTAADDILIATGAAVQGQGNFTGNSANNLSGSFGQQTTIALTAAGSAFFTDPVPFFKISVQDGQINNFSSAVGRQTLNGSLDIVFPVPEPSSLALVGLGLLCIGGLRRRSI